MGKGSEMSSVNGQDESPARVKKDHDPHTLTRYAWSEVKKHNTIEDCWIVLNGNVYDVTKFLRSHPGGVKVIGYYAGQDATEVTNAFHKEFDRVEKWSKMYLIGRIDDSPVDEKAKRRELIRTDFENVRQKAFKMVGIGNKLASICT
jgi:cytochrome b involved in lipid metabolism